MNSASAFINTFTNKRRTNLNNYSIRQLFLGLLISLTVVSCVTINIYFPAAAAEEAAEKIIDEVLNIDATKNKSEPQPLNLNINKEKEKEKEKNNLTLQQPVFIAIVDFFIPAVEAAPANILIETAKIRSIRNSMGKRQSKLGSYYQSGAIGFTNNGLIAITGVKQLSAKQRSTANKLIKSENKDRNKLYREIANANGHPEWQADIQKTFSHTWISKISSGWMFQGSSGRWQKK